MRKLFVILAGIAISQLPVSAGVDANGSKTVETAEEEPDYTNWITLGIGGAWAEDDVAGFQRRHTMNDGVFGGLEDLHWEPKISDKVTLTLDGHALGGIEDYLADVKLTITDVGYLHAGYRKFRTFYDGHGGYYPRTDLSFDLYDNEFHVDRESIWVELGLRLPKWPEITFRYEHQTRDGTKDSTIWGETALTGLTSNNTRGIVPTFLNIDETRDIFTIDLKHTIGPVDFGGGVRWENQDTDHDRNVRRRPFEATTDRFFTHRETNEVDLFAVHTYMTARFGKKFQASVAYMFTTLENEMGGSRIYGASYDPIFDPLYPRRQRRDEGFLDLMGGADLDQHVVTLSGAWRPLKDLVIIPSFRFENNELSSASDAIETVVPPSGPLVVRFEPLLAESERDFDSVTEALEIRYSGVKKWSFYLKGEWMQEDLSQIERDFEFEEEEPSLLIGRDTEADICMQKYVIGANFYPSSAINIAAQYYKKIYENDYDHPFDTTPNTVTNGDRYPAFLREQDFDTDDFNIRVTWRPISNFTSVSRYDYQMSTIETRGDLLDLVESADITAHILSETITWNPLPRLYLQGSIHYVWNETNTPSDQHIGDIVQDMQNDYWNGTVTVGYALGDKTDLQVNYFYYRADNFEDNSLVSQPYGSDAEEHAVTAVLNHEFSRHIRGSLRYGYFSNRTDAYGGLHDYDAHMVGASLQYRF